MKTVYRVDLSNNEYPEDRHDESYLVLADNKDEALMLVLADSNYFIYSEYPEIEKFCSDFKYIGADKSSHVITRMD